MVFFSFNKNRIVNKMIERVVANNCIKTVEKQNIIHKKSELLAVTHF